MVKSSSEVQQQKIPDAAVSDVPAIPYSTSNSSTDKLVSLMGKMKYKIKKLGDDMTSLNQKLSSFDISHVLTPERLTTKEGIQTSRKEVRTLQSLIDERQSILQRYFAGVENLIKTEDVSEVDRTQTLDGFNKGKTNTKKLYDALRDAQAASMKSTTDLLDFAENILGSTLVQDGKIMFQTKTDLDEYNRLMGILRSGSTREEAVTSQIMAKIQSSRQEMLKEYHE